jgi:hypothetical protein
VWPFFVANSHYGSTEAAPSNMHVLHASEMVHCTLVPPAVLQTLKLSSPMRALQKPGVCAGAAPDAAAGQGLPKGRLSAVQHLHLRTGEDAPQCMHAVPLLLHRWNRLLAYEDALASTTFESALNSRPAGGLSACVEHMKPGVLALC